ncbi:hypothetical protein ABAC460_13570 [Asticcacaulis sp. AC460]|uniref:calcium-binding protein n=1 Tax=Asticcacaulis sp. AC460 TaxID=1282360 RepID=UPI0003C3EFB8|nr:calcium-binding protein [Asticcacaulis sp. AC460]ESQ89093.1 hypothetical protein ABAC460_13570 [Asticcacaulis sp. AC460]
MTYFPGTPDNDVYAGGSDKDGINGLGGNDTLSGGDGQDTIFGGDGHDWIDGGSGDDIMGGGLGNDTFIVDSTGDTVLEGGNQGIDLVRASVSFSLAGRQIEYLTLTGLAHINATGNGFNNLLIGNEGNNVLDGGAGADILQGGMGDDTYYVDHAGDNVVEAHLQGTDTIYASVSYSLFGRAVENLILTGAANLSATGNSLANTLTGNSGKNVLDGGTGADVLRGGTGDDTYYVDNAGDNVVEAHYEGTDTVRASVSYSLVGRAVENLVLSGAGHLNATGNSLHNVLTGNAGNNVIDGGGGKDTMTGGLGDDTFYVNSVEDVVFEANNGGNDVLLLNVSAPVYLMPEWVEQAIMLGGAGDITGNTRANLIDATNSKVTKPDNRLDGDSGNDTLIGGAGDDTLIGGTGNDSLAGGTGSDVLSGSGGDDTMVGGTGGDAYSVDSAGDVVIEVSENSVDLLSASISYVLPEFIETLTLIGTGNIDGTGNNLRNLLIGNAGNNVLTGGAGNDNFHFGRKVGQDTIADMDGEEGDRIDIALHTHGTVTPGIVTQSGADVLIDLGNGNTVLVLSDTVENVLPYILW